MSMQQRFNVESDAYLDTLLGRNEEEKKLERFRLGMHDSRTVFDRVLEQATEISSRFNDVTWRVGDLHIGLNETGTAPILIHKPSGQTFLFSWQGLSQLATRLGMTATRYLKRCLSEGKADLIPLNLNRWKAEHQDRILLFRVYNDHYVHSVLSERYTIFDHHEVLESLQEALSSVGAQFEVEAFNVTPDNMSLRVVDPEKVIVQRHNAFGTDRSTAGMLIRNGQTGGSSVSIEFLVYTFACTNGLIVADDRGLVYRRRHVHIGREQFIEEVVETFKTFPIYVEQARKSIDRARLTRLDIENRAEIFNFVKTGLQCGDDVVEEIYKTMDSSWDRTAWGLAGAITEVAQTMHAERQIQFERFAGTLMHQLSA